MNKVILSGNLVRDIELRRSQSGEAVVSNAVAVRREFKNAGGDYDTDFINFVVWGKQAEYLNDYGKKGDRVELVGRWQTRKYTNKDGADVLVNEVVVESITVFSKEPKQTQPTQQPKEQYNGYDFNDEDLPF